MDSGREPAPQAKDRVRDLVAGYDRLALVLPGGGAQVPKILQSREPVLGLVAGDDRGVDRADRDARDPVGLASRLRERVVDVGRVGTELKGAWTGPAALSLNPHALTPVADRPVLEVISATHMLCDLTLGLGKVVHDYLR